MPIDLARIKHAPGLLSLAKTAAVSLERHGLDSLKASVYLLLDHSRSMQGYYDSGAVQHLADQALALCAHLDDDGTVPLIFFGSHASPARPVRLVSHRGIVDRLHPRQMWGSTNLSSGINAVVDHYRASQTTKPGLVIVQTDGKPDSERLARQALVQASELPLFWSFVGFGPQIKFLTELDQIPDRAVDNASAWHATHPLDTPDEELYDGLLREVPEWLAAARGRGFL